MKKKLLSCFIILMGYAIGAQSQENKTMYLDFGPDDVTNGNGTASPDKNGKYWNNMTVPSHTASSVYLVGADNVLTGAYVDIITDFSKNGINHGGLLAPDDALLNDFAINTATQDYFFAQSTPAELSIKGLDKNKGYVFSLFGTRENAEKRTTVYLIQGLNICYDTLQTSGTDIGEGGYDGNNQTIIITDTIMADTAGQINITVKKDEGSFSYLGIMKIQEVSPIMVKDTFALCKEKDQYHFAVMGSSVAYGTGASNPSVSGYAALYNQLLDDRYSEEIGKPREMTNISIGGNSTINVLDRWDTDLLPLCSKYVVYGLSLANEGIFTGGQAIFEQFRDNMQILISKARENDIVPIVVNCYAHSNYNSTDYDYIKQMNILIHSWDVPSINVLGAVDDGVGRWATGYKNDDGHPNDAGHQEFMYSFVPSLFDALDQEKPQPELIENTSLTLDPDKSNFRLEFTAEEVLHSFALSFEIQTESTGPIAEFETTTEKRYLSIDDRGMLNYLTASDKQIAGETSITDNNWHKITLSHYYAMGKTFLYIDNILHGSFEEKLVASTFNIGASNAPAANYRELCFYRSALNADEVAALVDNKLLKSSLEIYSPLDEKAVYSSDTLINLAQSMNKLIKVEPGDPIEILTSANSYPSISISIYPNPAQSYLTISSKDDFSNLAITNMNGTLLKSIDNTNKTIDVSFLTSGIYMLQLTGKNGVYNQKFIKADY